MSHKSPAYSMQPKSRLRGDSTSDDSEYKDPEMAKKYSARRTTIATGLLFLLGGLITTAGISIHRIETLSLPISKAIGVATLILPLFTAFTFQIDPSLYLPASADASFNRLPRGWITIAMFVALTIYETVIITLSLTHMVPPSDLTCHLDQRWRKMYSSKNTEGIKRIQDAHKCCGLHSVKDMAWPFPAKGRPATACADTFGRDKSCFGSWRRDEQISGGLFLLVAVGTLLIKVTLLIIARPRPWTQSTDGEHQDEPSPANHRQGRIEAPYHDDDDDAQDMEAGVPTSADGRAITLGDGHAEGPAMQPSSFQGEQRERNEWA